MMNLAIRGIEADLGEEQADTFRRLYFKLRSFFFWLNKRIPQGQFARGNRQRVVRVAQTAVRRFYSQIGWRPLGKHLAMQAVSIDE